jgi:hypothetical protein
MKPLSIERYRQFVIALLAEFPTSRSHATKLASLQFVHAKSLAASGIGDTRTLKAVKIVFALRR